MNELLLFGLAVAVAVLLVDRLTAGRALGLVRRAGASIVMPIVEQRRAQARAEAMLRGLLTPGEYGQLRAQGYLEVPSKRHLGRVYRVRRDRGAVERYENGKFRSAYCVGPVEQLPPGDVIALHKLRIAGAEAEYLGIANLVYGERTVDV